MKTKAIILFCAGLCFSTFSFAQKQGNVWMFGSLNFNTVPLTQFTGRSTGGRRGLEASGCIGDSSGKLLFYSEESALYNNRNQAMINGTGLATDFTSAQSCVIVPKPGSDSLFYVFTADSQTPYTNKTKPYGYNYSIVNMCLDHRGGDTALGAVIAAQKNIHLVDSGTEKLCAASDGATGYWVLGHRMFSDSFVAWHLTGTGLSAAVVSRIGPRVGRVKGAAVSGISGQMKFNAAGTRVGVANWYATSAPTMDLFDFNPVTGQLSNHCQTVLTTDSNVVAYGLEFSPDGSKIYISCYTGLITYVLQYAIGSNCALIANTRDTIFARSGLGLTVLGLQAGPDGKLYVGYQDIFAKKKELHRINNPNAAGPAISYDTAAYLFNYSIPAAPTPPSFVAGYKYGNRLCKCGQTASVPELAGHAALRVHPNPANANVSFDINPSGNSEMWLSITDITGRIIHRDLALPASVDVRAQPDGLYFYKVTTGREIISAGKFSVVH